MNLENLEEIGKILIAVGAIVGALLILFQNTEKLWNKYLWPIVKNIAFFCILVIPIGIIIWFFMTLAAQHESRLDEQVVVWSLVAQATLAISAYTFLWGGVLYPKTKFLLKWSTKQSTMNTDKQEISHKKSDDACNQSDEKSNQLQEK